MEQTEIEVDVDMTSDTADAIEGLIMEEGRNDQRPQTLPAQAQAPFSLAPAIYTPFQGFDDLLDSDLEADTLKPHIEGAGNAIQPTHVTGNSTEKATEKSPVKVAEKTTERATNKATEKSGHATDNHVNETEPEKLEMIISKIKRQQELVKDNMMYLTEIHLQTLQTQARHQVEQLEGGESGDENSNTTQEDYERRQKLNDKVWERLNGKALKEEDAKLGEFLPGRDMDGEIMDRYRDVDMSSVKSRAVTSVYEALKRKVKEAIEGAAKEVRVYGEHAEGNLERYKSILANRTAEIDAGNLSLLMGDDDTVMGGVETTGTAAHALDSILSPAFDFGSSTYPPPKPA